MRLLSRVALATGGALLLSLTAVPLAYAVEGDDANAADSSTTQMTREELKAAAEKRMAEAKEKAAKIKAETEARKAKLQQRAEKLSAAKLQICQKRETVINGVMSRMSSRGQKQLDLITAVSTKVQAFKNSKNITVADYDTLLAAVESSKATAQTAVDAVKNTQVEFKCDGSDPKGAGSSFREAVKAQDAALKAYRDAVKDLIKAVRQANGTNRSTSPTPTPSTNSDDGTADQGQGDN
jgi:uncharacterized protein YukE